MKILVGTFLACMAASSLAQVDPNKTVFSVNGESVKGEEYFTRMEHLPNVGVNLGGGRIAVYQPGFLTIVQLIDDHLTLQLARQKGVYPTDQEVQDWLKVAMDSDPKIEEKWLSSGRTLPELNDALRVEVASFKLQTLGITVSDEQVTDFYHTHQIPGLTIQPRTCTLRLIAVSDISKEKAIDDELAAGKAFPDVAKASSEDVTASNGGLLGTVPTDMLPKDVVQAIDSTKVGQTTGWVDIQNAHVKYFIESKEPEKPLQFTDQLKNQIRRKLMLDKGSVSNHLAQELADMRKKAQVDIADKQYAAMYQEFRSTFGGTVASTESKNGG